MKDNLTLIQSDEAHPLSLGEEVAAGVIDTIEADLSLHIRRRQMQSAQDRLRKIRGDFERMVQELRDNYSEDEAHLVRLYVEGCREELQQCYMTVSRRVAATTEGRTRIGELVDALLQGVLSKLTQEEPSDPPAPGPGGPSRKRRS